MSSLISATDVWWKPRTLTFSTFLMKVDVDYCMHFSRPLAWAQSWVVLRRLRDGYTCCILILGVGGQALSQLFDTRHLLEELKCIVWNYSLVFKPLWDVAAEGISGLCETYSLNVLHFWLFDKWWTYLLIAVLVLNIALIASCATVCLTTVCSGSCWDGRTQIFPGQQLKLF